MTQNNKPFDADRVEAKLSQEVQGQYKDSTMGKGAKLAMELNAERKRLKQEMDDLQVEVEDLRPATPTGTIDSHVKWVATIFAVVGVFIMSAASAWSSTEFATMMSGRPSRATTSSTGRISSNLSIFASATRMRGFS